MSALQNTSLGAEGSTMVVANDINPTVAAMVTLRPHKTVSLSSRVVLLSFVFFGIFCNQDALICHQ